jgi:hypothetical protein
MSPCHVLLMLECMEQARPLRGTFILSPPPLPPTACTIICPNYI